MQEAYVKITKDGTKEVHPMSEYNRMKRLESIKEKIIVGIFAMVSLSLVGWGVFSGYQDAKKDRETAFDTAGTVQTVRSVFETGRWFSSVVNETVFVTVNGQEYQVSKALAEQLHQGDQVKVSGKRGEINTIEKVTP